MNGKLADTALVMHREEEEYISKTQLHKANYLVKRQSKIQFLTILLYCKCSTIVDSFLESFLIAIRHSHNLLMTALATAEIFFFFIILNHRNLTWIDKVPTEKIRRSINRNNRSMNKWSGDVSFPSFILMLKTDFMAWNPRPI